jgi:hypothetical protein
MSQLMLEKKGSYLLAVNLKIYSSEKLSDQGR